MSQTAREQLSGAQAELLRALVANGPIPAGFDEQRLRATARSLINKRRQSLARAWPNLIRILGDAYRERFAQYAQAHPLPTGGAPLADGRAFLRWLDSQQPLCDAARLEALAFDMRFTMTADGLRPRHGMVVKLVKLRETPALVVAARLPWLGECRWRIPLGKFSKPAAK